MEYSIPKLLGSSKPVNYRTEILSGLTVALALVPEAIAFAMIAGFSPLTGLYAAFVMGFVTSILGGRPAMISGATGAIAVIFVGLINQLRSEMPGIGNDQIMQFVFATVILAGLLQILAGVFKLGKFIRLVPHPVMYGFVNGLAIIIFMAQFPNFTSIVEDNPSLTEFFSGVGVSNVELLNSGFLELGIMVGLVVATMLIIWLFPKITKAIPSSLVAILVISGIVVLLGIPTAAVADTLAPGETTKGTFPPLTIPIIDLNWQTLSLIFPFAQLWRVWDLLRVF